jgi:hypothetical protein
MNQRCDTPKPHPSQGEPDNATVVQLAILLTWLEEFHPEKWRVINDIVVDILEMIREDFSESEILQYILRNYPVKK